MLPILRFAVAATQPTSGQYWVLLPVAGRPHLLYLSRLDANDDEHGRRLAAESRAKEGLRLRFVRLDGD